MIWPNGRELAPRVEMEIWRGMLMLDRASWALHSPQRYFNMTKL